MATTTTSKETFSTDRKEKKWFPIESNPTVMNEYICQLGYPIDSFCFHDVLSIEEWGIAMIPKPVIGILLLYPLKEHSEQYRIEEGERIKRNGQIVSENVYYMKQNVGNACGTIGILHAIGNSTNEVVFEKNSFLDHFITETKNLSPEQRAEALEKNEEIERGHEIAANQGQTENQSIDEDINSHFICFTQVDGCLYELDGRKDFPINHGPCSKDSFLQATCQVIETFMKRDEGEVRFTIVALAAASN